MVMEALAAMNVYEVRFSHQPPKAADAPRPPWRASSMRHVLARNVHAAARAVERAYEDVQIDQIVKRSSGEILTGEGE